MTQLTRESSLRTIVAASKSDTINQPGDWTAIIIDSPGIVKFTTANGNDISLTLAAGIHPISVSRIWSTTTTVASVWLGSYGVIKTTNS